MPLVLPGDLPDGEGPWDEDVLGFTHDDEDDYDESEYDYEDHDPTAGTGGF